MAYNDLSIREKAALIRMSVANGLHRLSDIKSAYNQYAEGGNKTQVNHITTTGATKNQVQTVSIGNVGNTAIYQFNNQNSQGPWSESTVITPDFVNIQADDNVHTYYKDKDKTQYDWQVERLHKINKSTPVLGNIFPEIIVTPSQHSTGGPLYPFSFSKQGLPQVRFDEGGQELEVGSGPILPPTLFEAAPANKKLIQPVERTGLEWNGSGPFSYLRDIAIRNELLKGKSTYDTQNNKVSGFFTNDVLPRYQRQHPNASSQELATIMNAIQTPWKMLPMEKGVYAANTYDSGNLFNPMYQLSNSTIVHEDTHQYRNRDLNLLRFNDTDGYSNEEIDLLSRAYDLSDMDDVTRRRERGAANSELRYRIRQDYIRKNKGKEPTIDELDTYIDSLSNQDMLMFMQDNAYLESDLLDSRIYDSDAARKLGSDRLTEIDKILEEGSSDDEKSLLKEARQLEKKINRFKRTKTKEAYNFDNVKKALKYVAKNNDDTDNSALV